VRDVLQLINSGRVTLLQERMSGLHADLSSALLFLLASLTLTMMLIYSVLRYRLVWIPNSTIVLLTGFVVGAVINYSTPYPGDAVFVLAPEAFFFVMLPPIMFDAGLTLNKEYFFKNLLPILLLAVIGTAISTVIVGVGLWAGFGGLSDMSLVDALMFGALISAVDPVATLAVFHSLDVNHTLHMVVFGESVLNDAVCLVMYQTLSIFRTDPVSAATIAQAIGEFLLILIGSTIIGSVCGLLAALFFKWIDINNFPALEMSVFFTMTYVPYLIAEASSLSGITRHQIMLQHLQGKRLWCTQQQIT